MSRTLAMRIGDPSQVGEVRRAATKLAADVGLDDVATGRVALIATELGTNILKHAQRGEIMLRSSNGQLAGGVELVAIDSGPGISNLDRALQDGFSTAGSSGTGLGALGRLATTFDVFSGAGRGTVFVARVAPSTKHIPRALEVGVIQVPKGQEPVCGDDWSLTTHGSGSSLLVVADGLGHGMAAADASRMASRVAAERPEEGAAETITAIHGALRST
ncbi:MAG TPA: ATP-binding SpoIIE family protein phosphatase, partial [Gemmatimonadaceae bacterium]|nr:ATP-binding SpoIIE family protein phosphatase [Gemmatimonadaceae bacterium]